MKKDGTTCVHGLRAAQAALQRRPEAVLRVLYARARQAELAPLLAQARDLGREVREAEPDELARLARSVHHGGVVVNTRPLPLLSRDELLRRLPRGAVLLALDGVANPHNLGAILRSAAWFGATAVLFPGGPGQAHLTPAALRTAMGAAEAVPMAAVGDLPQALRRLTREGVQVVAAEVQGGEPLPTAALTRPLCLVLGNEEEGLTPAVRAACPRRITLPGTGAVESLNVSVVAGVLLAAATRDGPGDVL